MDAFKATGTGDITITNNATVGGGISAVHRDSTGNILINGSGSIANSINTGNTAVGIRAMHRGPSGGITISGSGAVQGPTQSFAVSAIIVSAANSSDILYNRSGAVSSGNLAAGGIALTTAGAGNITLTGFGPVTSKDTSILVTAQGGNVAITGGGDVTASATGIRVSGLGNIQLDLAGAVSGTQAIAVQTTLGGIDITSRNVTAFATGIDAMLTGAVNRNLAITTNGVTTSTDGGTAIQALIASPGASGTSRSRGTRRSTAGPASLRIMKAPARRR